MKVRPDMIIKGSLVTHTASGRKGVVLKVDGDTLLVCWSYLDGQCWHNVSELEWTDAEVMKPASRRVTISKVLINQNVNHLLHRWCEIAAANGGSFGIDQEFSREQWWTTYTIEWPDGVVIPEGSTA